jgi:exonuclease SbcC
MKLISAELQNVCQFRHLQVKFAPGLTAIIGRNGSGKSNLVKMIYAAVTGDFGRNDGVKTDNVCQFAELGTSSRINTVVEHGGSTLEITRSLRPVSTRLRVTAQGVPDQNIGKAQEATETIAGILGVSSRMLADYVFVDQWSIFDFLSMMPAERAKAFQRLFRTEKAEALWKIIGAHIDDIVIPTPGIDKDAVNKRLQESHELHAGLTETLTEIDAELQKIDVEALRKQQTDWLHTKALQLEIGELTRRMATLDAEMKGLFTQLVQLSEEDKALTDYVTTEKEHYVTARNVITTWDHHVGSEHNRSQLVTQIEAARRELAALESAEPQKPFNFVPSDEQSWYEESNKTHQEVLRLRKLVELGSAGTTCETCGAPLDKVVANLPAYQINLVLAEGMLLGYEQQRRDSRAYEKRMVEYHAKRGELHQRIKHMGEQLGSMQLIPRPDKSKEEMQEFAQQYDQMTRAQQETHEALNKIERQYQSKKAVYEQLDEDLQRKNLERLQLQNVTEDSARLATIQLEACTDYQAKRVEVAARIRVLDRAVSDDEMALAQLETVEHEAQATRAWAGYCQELRHVFHRDSLPRLVAQNYLELMEDEINNLLVRFGSTFSVRADETLSFMATFHDGRKVPAARLSGGEKVLLALAFRVAVNDIFAKDLGLLVLDEPTAGLDEGNLACLRVAIERLKELSSARGLQVIMITHERDLHNLFDHVIEMGKES